MRTRVGFDLHNERLSLNQSWDWNKFELDHEIGAMVGSSLLPLHAFYAWESL